MIEILVKHSYVDKNYSLNIFQTKNVSATQQHGLSIVFFNPGVKYEHQDTMSICSDTVTSNYLKSVTSIASIHRKCIRVQNFIIKHKSQFSIISKKKEEKIK